MNITKNYPPNFNFIDVSRMECDEYVEIENFTRFYIPFYEENNDPMKDKKNWDGPVDYFLAINGIEL